MKKLLVNNKIYIISLLLVFILFYILYQCFTETLLFYEYFIFKGGNPNFIKSVASSVLTQFTHMDLFHLITNSVFLFYVTNESSEYFSIKKYIIISSVSVLFLAVILLLFAKSDIVYVGASGWIGSVLGAVLLHSLIDNKKINSKNISLFCTGVLFLAIPLVIHQISALMHFSGFFFGLFFELVIEKIFDWK